jgi:predicted phage baseplate assembly protein
MPLQPPNLDNRAYADILSDLQLRIPRYAREWTNFNDSDPGMTLLQLFAWLSEQMLYQMNQVPMRNYVKFLQLLGQELQPAQPALARLTFTTSGGTAVASPVPLHAQIVAAATDGGLPIVFETDSALELIQPLMDVVGSFDGANFTNVSDANATPGATFLPFGWSADIGNALYLGFLAPNPMPPSDSVPFFPQQMTFAVFLPPSATAGAPQACTGAGILLPPAPPVTLIWEYRPATGQDWQRLNVFSDGSAAFTREGYIKVAGPQTIQPAVEPQLSSDPHFWIRVRIGGATTYPAGTVPTLEVLRPNTVDAYNLATVSGEILGVSEGHPNETVTLQYTPVQLSSVQIQTVIPPDGAPVSWLLKDDFFSSGPDDAVFTLDPDSGAIQFGDGDRGLIPSPGAQVIATSYRYGGGSRGNVPAGAINSPLTSLVGVAQVSNIRAAAGGSDEETLDDILVKTPALLGRRDRAVTPADFESQVKAVSGIAAAKALPLFHPDFPGVSVPGAVTIVVVPDNHDVPPKPSSDLIRGLCADLDTVRLLTTEVFVKGPSYQEIRVEALVAANPYASFDSVSEDVIRAIDAFLDPRQGNFGAQLFPTKLYAAISGANPNVIGVLTLNLFVDGRRYTDTSLQPISLPPDGLFYGANHIVTVTASN